MYNGKYVTVHHVIEKIHRDYRFTYGIEDADILEDVYDAMSFIGVPQAYTRRITNGVEPNPEPITIENYRGELPIDLYQVEGCRRVEDNYPMIETSSTFNNASITDPSDDDENLTSTESMMSYFINDNYIFTSFEEGEVEMAYLAFPTDKDGLPHIPDIPHYIRAVAAYVAKQIGFRLYMEDKLSERKLERLEQDWFFAVNSAKTKVLMPSYDQAEALKNQLVRMTQFSKHHAYAFRFLNTPEINKIHPR